MPPAALDRGRTTAMLHRYGEFVVRRARLLLAFSGLLLIAAAIFGAGAFDKLQNGGFDDPAAQSSQAQHLINERYGGQTNLVLLVTTKAGTVDDPAVAAAGRQLAADLAAEPDLTSVFSYWTTKAPGLKSTDGTQAIVLGHIGGTDSQLVPRSKELVAKYAGDRAAVSVLVGGQGGTFRDVNTQVTTSLAIAEAVAVPLILVLLVIVFGSVVSALLPLAIGLVAILGTFAELAFLGSVTDVSVFAINLTTALGLGLGIDYALFMVSRFREQLASGDAVPEAVARTVATAGRTIVFSAATVAAALAALLMRRPGAVALPVVGVLLFAATPLLGVSFGTPDQGVLRPSASSRQVADTLVAKFPGNVSSPVEVVLTGPVSPAALADYAHRLSALPGVARVRSEEHTSELQS